MVRIHAEPVGPDKALVNRNELDRLVEAARKVEEVEVVEVIERLDDLPLEGLMRLAAEGGSFKFLKDPREEIYTVNDLKVRYR